MTTIQILQDFDDWMRKIKNIHYGNNEQIQKAYERLIPQSND